jgi:hypothetical protein
MTPEDVARLLTRLTVTWPNFKLPGDPETLAVMIEVWCEALEGVSNPEATAAVKSLMSEGGAFAPAVGQVRRRALELRQQVTGQGGPPSGAEAWSEVLELIRGRGYMLAPEAQHCSHPAVHRAIEVFGWMNLCKSENQMADRAHFIRFYEEVAAGHRDHMATPAAALEATHQPMLDSGRSSGEDAVPYRGEQQ